jgi:type IV secretion system protein VirB1
MMLALATLAAYLQACASAVAPDTMRAIISVESRGYIYAINDNTAHASYCVPGATVFPCSGDQAAALAERAVRSGHSVDVGIAQVNSGNFRTYGVSATQMLDPCENLRIGTEILSNAYRRSTARFADERAALWHAIMAYNTGSLYTGEAYVRSVVDAALPTRVTPTVPSIKLFQDSMVAMIRRPGTLALHSRHGIARRDVGSSSDPREAALTVSGLDHPTDRGDLNASLGPISSW